MIFLSMSVFVVFHSALPMPVRADIQPLPFHSLVACHAARDGMIKHMITTIDELSIREGLISEYVIEWRCEALKGSAGV